MKVAWNLLYLTTRRASYSDKNQRDQPFPHSHIPLASETSASFPLPQNFPRYPIIYASITWQKFCVIQPGLSTWNSVSQRRHTAAQIWKCLWKYNARLIRFVVYQNRVKCGTQDQGAKTRTQKQVWQERSRATRLALRANCAVII